MRLHTSGAQRLQHFAQRLLSGAQYDVVQLQRDDVAALVAESDENQGASPDGLSFKQAVNTVRRKLSVSGAILL